MERQTIFPKSTCLRVGRIMIFLICFLWHSVSFAGTDKETLRLFFWQAPTVFNPHLSFGVKDRDACRITYEPLATFDAEGHMVPLLATEIPSLENGGLASDGRSVSWKLKSGLTWSDGHPFSADDVVFTYEFISNPETKAFSASIYDEIEDVVALDDSSVKIYFKTVNPAWTLPFVGIQGEILPRHIFESYNNAQALDSAAKLARVGTGPYIMRELSVEDTILVGDDVVEMIKILYERNPYFRDEEKPFFKQVELYGGGDAMLAARSVLHDGRADFAWNLQVDRQTLQEMQSAGMGEVKYTTGSQVERILLNFSDPNRTAQNGERSSVLFPHPFFQDKRVRQAIAHAIDRESIAALYCENACSTTNVLVAPTRYASPTTQALYPFNLERAAELLDDAGWVDSDHDGIRDKEGRQMTLLFQTSINPVRQNTQQIVKDALRTIGVNVELKAIDASIFFNNDPTNDNNFQKFYADLQEFYTGNTTPDPGDFMGWFTCDQIVQQANNWSYRNRTRWCNPSYDELYRQSQRELDPEKRRRLFIRMNDLLVEDVVLIPLVKRTRAIAVHHTLDGIAPTPWDSNTWNIKDWKRKTVSSGQ